MEERRKKCQIGLYISFVTFLVFCSYVEPFSFSTFSQTTVVINTCFPKSMKSFPNVHKLMDCGNKCIGESECRRFLYCYSDSTCQLYHDGTNCTTDNDSTSCYCYRKDIGCNGNNCTCPLGFYGDRCEFIVQDCYEAKEKGLISGLTNIKPRLSVESFEVSCRFSKTGTTNIMKRSTLCLPESFNRSLKEYEDGFGTVPDSRWLGFTKILSIMNSSPGYIYVLQFFRYTKTYPCYTYYQNFQLGDKASSYTLRGNVSSGGKYRNCGDSLFGKLSLYGRPFSTYDSDHTGANNCSARYGGGWWFHDSPDCTRSFLMGTLNKSVNENFWLEDIAGERFDWFTLNLRRR